MAKPSTSRRRTRKADADPAPTWSGADSLRPLLVPVAGLRPDPLNARDHSDERGREALRASLRTFGQQKPVVVSRFEAGTVIAGSGLLLAAVDLGWSHVAASLSSCATREDERAYAIADNRTAELSAWGFPELARELRELQSGGYDLALTAWQPHEWEPLLAATWEARKGSSDADDEHAGVSVHFTDEQFETVSRAITAVRRIADDGGAGLKNGRLIELALADWLAGQPGGG